MNGHRAPGISHQPTALASAFIAIVALAPLVMGAAAPVAAQAVDVTSRPADPISGVPAVRLTGFPAGAEVVVAFTRTPPDGLPPAFSARARYRVGPDGSVDIASPPLGGDWTSAAPEAPYWSMRPDTTASLRAPDLVQVRATAGSVGAQAEFRIASPSGGIVEPVAAFAGAFLVRPATATTRLPLIIVLGGSEGDDHTARRIAPALAAHGYAVLGLPYYSPDQGRGQAIPGLPSVFSEIPVDRLEQVHRWAVADPRIDAERIGVWGQSKGGEFAILAAATYPWIDAVAAIVPSDVVWEGFGSGALERTGTASFSLHGKPLPFVRYGTPGRGTASKEAGRTRFPDDVVAARIPIERFKGLLLVAGGGDDRSWNSAAMSEAIARTRAEHRLHVVSLIFPDAGHSLAGDLTSPIDTRRGGTAEGTGTARKAIWAATLELFRAAWR